MKPVLTCAPAGSEASALSDLSRHLGLKAPAQFFGHDPHGRPRATAAGKPLAVSLSHCGAVCAMALSTSGRVGVDLTDPASSISTEGLMDLASPREQRWLQTIPENQKRLKLFQLWACREALLKALGLGLTLDPMAVELEPREGGFRATQVPGCSSSPEAWHVETMDGSGPAKGLILALAWAE